MIKKFKGLTLNIEYPKGSTRTWKDLYGNVYRSTKMYADYGYIVGTENIDGDDIDIYLGPEDSDRVFVITQMKPPEFKSVDENKVMLGFSSRDEAVSNYLQHYTDPRFIGAVTEMTLGELQSKIPKSRGELLKSHNYFVRIPTKDKAVSMSDKKALIEKLDSMSKSLDDIILDFESERVTKALKASIVHSMAKEQKAQEAAVEREAYFAPVAFDTREMGTFRVAPMHEPPVVPVRRIPFPGWDE
jgi:hypothetical protein